MVLLILGSSSNAIGYQTILSSHQQTVKEEVSQRELLFQTIIDIANNKEIQRIILTSQISRGIVPSDISVLTKSQIKQMYFFGLIPTTCISKSKIHTMVHKYQFFNTEMQKEISVIIEKDATLNAKIAQLQNSECDCENKDTPLSGNSPILCLLLFPLFVFGKILIIGYGIFLLDTVMMIIGSILNCFWAIV